MGQMEKERETRMAKKRVLLIDPWGIANTSEYLNGLIFGLALLTDLTVFTNVYFESKTDTICRLNRIFFPRSENMAVGKKRTILRGWEYLYAYQQIFQHLQEQGPYDIIHINWLLMYQLDIHFLKRLKKYCGKLVYTAHNVLPHQNGEKSIPSLRKIYHLVDRIVLHGAPIREEFSHYFLEEVHKVCLQKHGCNLKPQTSFDVASIPENISQKLQRFPNKYLFFGGVYYNKGADRLIPIWRRAPKNALLILAGKTNGAYPELEQLREEIEQTDNILFLDEFVPNALLNYLIASADLVLLPYRHASMSGVIFTAADFAKPILCTKAGAFEEYLTDGADSFFAENDDAALAEVLCHTLTTVSKQQLSQMGFRLQENIRRVCAWNVVAEKLVRECYLSH